MADPNPRRANQSGGPPANPLATGAIIAVSLIAAVSYAVYESPEVRQFTERLRRQIQARLRQLGENIDPAQRARQYEDPFSGRMEMDEEPRFNRPEDAEAQGEENNVEGDEESERRQREELKYWNALRESQRLVNKGPMPPNTERRGSFSEFLHTDQDGHHVMVTGVDIAATEGLHRRGQALDRSNPFSDEHGIETDSQMSGWTTPVQKKDVDDNSEATADIYGATSRLAAAVSIAAEPVALSPINPSKSSLISSKECDEAVAGAFDNTPLVEKADPQIDLSDPFNPSEPRDKGKRKEVEEENPAHITCPQDDEAFAAIHAWNESASSLGQSGSDGTARNYNSPMLTTPKMQSQPQSLSSSISDLGAKPEAEKKNDSPTLNDWTDESEDGDGMMTPTDSMSIIGEEESVGGSEDGRHTPGSWTEVRSVVSEEDQQQQIR